MRYQVLDETRGPAVGEQQRARRRAPATHVWEVDTDAVDDRAKVRYLVELCNTCRPIVDTPASDKLANNRRIRAVRPILRNRIAVACVSRRPRRSSMARGSVSIANGLIVTALVYRLRDLKGAYAASWSSKCSCEAVPWVQLQTKVFACCTGEGGLARNPYEPYRHKRRCHVGGITVGRQAAYARMQSRRPLVLHRRARGAARACSQHRPCGRRFRPTVTRCRRDRKG